MLLEHGRIVEFDRFVEVGSDRTVSDIRLSPKALLSEPTSKFYHLCKASGKEEFATLKKLSGL
jgi:hypothetical protein